LARPDAQRWAHRRKRAGLLPLKRSSAEKIRAGLCGWCGERPFLPDGTRCQVCRDKNRAAHARLARKKQLTG
jgi:hypothetical protein